MPSERDFLDAIESHATTLAQASADVGVLADVAAAEATAARDAGLRDAEMQRDTQLAGAERDYTHGLAQLAQAFADIETASGIAGAPWADARWSRYVPPDAPPAVVRIGDLRLDGEFNQLATHALLPFTGGRNLVIKAGGAAKQHADAAAKALAVRLLALVPPTKLRLLLIDHATLGETLAEFDALKDADPNLIDGKIWTEERDIEERLGKLTEHMATVIQSYLQGRYDTFEAYNVDAGEVSEPYRLVVALGFPNGFNPEAAKRLLQVTKSGPRSGVFSIVTIDEDAAKKSGGLPHGFNMADLERNADVLVWDEDAFRWCNVGEALERARVTTDVPPPREQLHAIMASVGAAVRDASVVKIPFAGIRKDPSAWWTESSARDLTAQVGRAGARKVQELKLGNLDPEKGMQPHGLIVGAPGSGKSVLLHVLLGSLVTNYSPQELELYLIDFKQGVELKPYARYQLPHAKVVAIGCEREFALSVLRRLDQEIERRGEIFRRTGVEGVQGYRERIGEPMPRVLLLIDEFQVLFSEDDALADEAHMILDKIASQGRSSGVHMLMTSQTLRRGRSLRPATMEMMKLRVAMMCSDDEGRFVLADDNRATRTLNRPGAAIYNAQGGLKEGNSRFQAAFVSTDEIEELLQALRARADAAGLAARPLVFEGDADANLEDATSHPIFEALSQRPARGRMPAVARAWLGDPVSIKPPVAAEFARRGGRNLVIIGRAEDEALGMMSTAVISLAAQHHFEDVRFVIADFIGGSGGQNRFGHHLGRALSEVIETPNPRELMSRLESLAATVEQRAIEGRGDGQAIFLVLFGLQRARDLRRSEEYGVTYPATAQLAQILERGPEVGVHTLLWADQYASLERILQRSHLRELGLRVALPMNDEDSSNLLGNTKAAKLKSHRALFVDDDVVGEAEKFRPYGVPSDVWMSRLARQF